MFLGGVRAFKISRKCIDKMPTFNGSMEKFAYWKGKIIDQWKQVLKVTEASTVPITRAYLESIHVGFGDSAWPIAVDLETSWRRPLEKQCTVVGQDCVVAQKTRKAMD